MKHVARFLAVALLFVSVTAFAGNLDGVYKFSSRSKEGVADMNGWWGMLVITNNSMSRVFRSPDGNVDKFYVGNLAKDGDLYKLTLTQAYKPNYVGNEHKNKITLSGNTLTIESPDGKFKESWVKK